MFLAMEGFIISYFLPYLNTCLLIVSSPKGDFLSQEIITYWFIATVLTYSVFSILILTYLFLFTIKNKIMLYKSNKKWITFCLPLILVLYFILNAKYVCAHGTVTYPPSRVWVCHEENPENPDSPACINLVDQYGTQLLYDWNAIRQPFANGNHTDVVPNGQLASGGDPDKYGGLDETRSDWVKTPVSPGPLTVTWTNSAKHVTEYYRVYITNEDWTPDQPLRWDNITLLVETPFSLAENVVDIPVVLPERTGHHVIYSVWQRADSPEAFYSASDVDFGDSGMDDDDDDGDDDDGGMDDDDDDGDDGMDDASKRVIVDENLDVIKDFKVNEDVYFPALANGQIQNLTIDADGKVSTNDIALQVNNKDFEKKKFVHAINKFNFSVMDNGGAENLAREGLYFENGTQLKGIETLLLDNSASGGEGGSTIIVRIYRTSKTSRASSPDLIFEVSGSDTPSGKFESFSSDQLISSGSNTIDNEHYIYYAEIKYCKACDFTEVKFVSY